MNDIQQASNPLPFLLEEEAHGDRQATQALFLTFNADLGFFEARALGACLSAGARVCVLADAAVWSPDPRGAKNAGRSYHVGLTSVAGAFHPKVVALVGPKRAVVAIGSGNLTMGGWQHNSELWTVLRADEHRAPAALRDLPDFLTDLTSAPTDPVAVRALRRSASELDHLMRRCDEIVDTGHRILSSTRAPIIEQLPPGPVDRVWLYAPFHDPACRGVEAILRRLRPRHATVMIQPGLTVLEPNTLEHVLNREVPVWEAVADTELNHHGQPRYRHGKLIEWTTSSGDRFALTGSPNLSHAALLSAAGRGNTELAVLSHVQESLFPPHQAIVLQDAPPVRIHTTAEDVAGADALGTVLLAAVLETDGLHLHLSAPLRQVATLECSTHHDAPESWASLGQIPEALTSFLLKPEVKVPPGSRVRLSMATPHGLMTGPLIYITDRDAAERRHLAGPVSRTATARAQDLWGLDLSVLTALSNDLAALAADTTATKAPARARIDQDDDPDEQHPRNVQDTDTTPWLWVSRQGAHAHGSFLSAFGLALPTPADPDHDSTLGWEDQIVRDTEIALEDESTEAIEADDDVATPEPSTTPDHRNHPREVCRRRRSWCRKWAADLGTVPVASRLVATRLFLIFWAAGNWDPDDLEPYDLAWKMLGHLTTIDTQQDPDLDARIANLAMVGLQVTQDRIDLGTLDESTTTYRRLREQLKHLALAHDGQILATYCEFLTRPSGWPLTPDVVEGTMDELLQEDLFADTIHILEDEGHAVSRSGQRLLRVDGLFSNPNRVALSAIGRTEHDGPLGVWAVNQRGAWTLALWQRPDLITITALPAGKPLWQHHGIPTHLGPEAANDPLANRFRIPHGPRNTPFPEALTLLATLGLDGPTPR